MIAGATMMADDVKDFGELVCNGCDVMPDAPHPHHWLIGAITFVSGLAGVGLFTLALMLKSVQPR
jgi:hypothetical protein